MNKRQLKALRGPNAAAKSSLAKGSPIPGTTYVGANPVYADIAGKGEPQRFGKVTKGILFVIKQ